jgi:glycosyltransferase involved in cell wall biosynthesis
MSIHASIVIPTFNGASRIHKCLDSLVPQAKRYNAEILVVNDGSTDNTETVVRTYASVRFISQDNAGPATARNRGARKAQGGILLFTDDDCVPASDWLGEMLRPFEDPDVVGAKGAYRTVQRELIARFVQIEYEDRYRAMTTLPNIDFIDTYSAAFVRDRFTEMGGYDTAFPTACAEDIELSYRMSSRGWKMVFFPSAVVYHTHPASLLAYLKKKYKFAFWRVLAVRKNPKKCVKDSHTPQMMKLQLLLLPALALAIVSECLGWVAFPLGWIVLAAFVVSTLRFSRRAWVKDRMVGLASPALLAARASAQFLGIAAGLMRVLRTSCAVKRGSGDFRAEARVRLGDGECQTQEQANEY